ncbi:MAG: outer membrane protein assembly factor BamD [Polyangiales bacterium]|nr:outer membrane protein assembly factor BamD [Myxococcales bacterium]
MTRTTRLVLLVCAAASLGCGGSQRARTGKYAEDAQIAYEEAMDSFRDEDCLEAGPLFRDVRRKYPYSRFASLAELRSADCLFIDGKYSEAVQAYRQFVRNRPSHSEVPYARFKVAEAYYKQIPDSWFILAPAEEKDQVTTREALLELRRFVLDYTDDPRAKKADRMAQEAMTLLGKHEFYVAEFYYKRDFYRAAIIRLNTLLAVYPGSGIEPQALLMLGRSFVEIGDKSRAKRAFERLVAEYPTSGDADDARSELKSL